MSQRDSIYAESQPLIADFAFDQRVAQVFPDMIRRSVPGYAEVIAWSGLIASHYAQPGSRCYDLGSSLGATTLSLRRQIQTADTTIVAVDNAWPMVERCRAVLAEEPTAGAQVSLVCADIRDVMIRDASVVVLNFTLQFVPREQRLALLSRIRAGLRPGGVLLLAEKLTYPDAAEQAFQERMQLAFKRANGYSELEVAQKRAALERVLLPESEAEHRSRLATAGFTTTYCWLRCFNFAAFAAFAP